MSGKCWSLDTFFPSDAVLSWDEVLSICSVLLLFTFCDTRPTVFKIKQRSLWREARYFLAFRTVKIYFLDYLTPSIIFFHVLVSKRETILKNVKLNLPPFTFREMAPVKKKPAPTPWVIVHVWTLNIVIWWFCTRHRPPPLHNLRVNSAFYYYFRCVSFYWTAENG